MRRTPGTGPRPGPPAPSRVAPGRAGILCLALALATLAQGAGAQAPPSLSSFDLSKDGGEEYRLSGVLREVSGLAMTPDGRLFAHHDERAAFYQLDPESGEILKVFSAGLPARMGDFEGVAIAGERFFLMTSTGELLETSEGRPGASMSFRVSNTGLGRFCELEGLAYDPKEEALLAPCKTPQRKELEDHVVVFSIPLSTMTPLAVPRVFLPLEALEDQELDPDFHPSGIEVHPATGNLFLVAAREETLMELTPGGRLLSARELRKKNHPQPEGITFGPGLSLLLADEGQGGRGRLTRYPAGEGEGNRP